MRERDPVSAAAVPRAGDGRAAGGEDADQRYGQPLPVGRPGRLQPRAGAGRVPGAGAGVLGHYEGYPRSICRACAATQFMGLTRSLNGGSRPVGPSSGAAASATCLSPPALDSPPAGDAPAWAVRASSCRWKCACSGRADDADLCGRELRCHRAAARWVLFHYAALGRCVQTIRSLMPPQASTNTLLSHFVSLFFSLWLSRIISRGAGQPTGQVPAFS